MSFHTIMHYVVKDFNMKTVLIFYLFLKVFYIRHVYSKISTNCLQTLNTSDCHVTPTKVFSYYKPGSRCELEVWRGCPTGNKFDTEEECSESCIFKAVDFDNKVKHQFNAKCILPEDLNNCTEKLIHGFKYDKILLDCVEVDTNCPSNIFEDKLDCMQACVGDLTWYDKIKLLSDQQSRELDSILEIFLNSTSEGDEGSKTQSTDSDALKTTNVSITNSNVDTNTSYVTTIVPNSVKDGEVKKLVGDTNTTEPYEHKTDNNSTSANNETASIGSEVTGVTGVTKDNNANSTSNSESAKATTNENIARTHKVGTAPEVEIFK